MGPTADLRSTLGSVILFLDLIHGALAGAGLGRDAESALLARGEAVRLSEMLGDLLLVSRLEELPTLAQTDTGLRALLEEPPRTTQRGWERPAQAHGGAFGLVDRRAGASPSSCGCRRCRRSKCNT